MLTPSDVDSVTVLSAEERERYERTQTQIEESLRAKGEATVAGIRFDEYPRPIAILANRYEAAGWFVMHDKIAHVLTIKHPELVKPQRTV